MEVFKENRERLYNSSLKGFAFLQSGPSGERYNTDRDLAFRQESNFFWLTGVVEPDCNAFVDFEKKKTTLFVPKLPSEYAVWLGKIETLESIQKKYEIDAIYYNTEIGKFIEDNKITEVHVMKTLNFKPVAEIEKLVKKNEDLEYTIGELRVYKTDKEIELLRIASDNGSFGHIEAMKAVKPGKYEYQVQGKLLESYYSKGGQHTSFEAIIVAGKDSSTLHYIFNDKLIKDGDLVLIDAGTEHRCYASDITRTIPANGKYSDDQKMIYSIVLDAQKTCIEMLKPGVDFIDVHTTAVKTILKGLLKIGLVKGDFDELMEHHICSLFMPHGLGHSMGLDVHDCNGYPRGVERIKNPTYQYLRFHRKLEKGVVITIEPGCYFIDALLEPAIANPEVNKYLNLEMLARFRNFGGIRIEDDLVITETGYENLTKVPKEIDEIEKLLAQNN